MSVYGEWGDDFLVRPATFEERNDDKRDIESLVGKTVVGIKALECGNDTWFENDMVLLHCSDGTTCMMTHEQDCCESVSLEDVTGDFADLIGSPIVMAEESEDNERDDMSDSVTWTFYKFATVKGYVTVRWYGTSNGYYSESVDATWMGP